MSFLSFNHSCKRLLYITETENYSSLPHFSHRIYSISEICLSCPSIIRVVRDLQDDYLIEVKSPFHDECSSYGFESWETITKLVDIMCLLNFFFHSFTLSTAFSNSSNSNISTVKSPTSGLRLGLSRNQRVKPLHPSVNVT